MARMISGKVVSNTTPKTIVVEVERKVRHPMYKKIIKRNKKYLVDSNNLEVKIGDIVSIIEIKPMSKRKKFKLVGPSLINEGRKAKVK